jgi:2-amino-4-hydroxy-6-hydroxymethyldihydropteridine diphosphokinase
VLGEALRRLGAVIRIEAVSSVWESEPVGLAEQPDFWNLVVRGRTALTPDALLAALLGIEAGLGRVRGARNAPRTLDLDLLVHGDTVVRRPGLEVPHPRMLERAFVLMPLAELDPGLRHPVTERTVAEHLAAAPVLERCTPLFPGSELIRHDDAPA